MGVIIQLITGGGAQPCTNVYSCESQQMLIHMHAHFLAPDYNVIDIYTSMHIYIYTRTYIYIHIGTRTHTHDTMYVSVIENQASLTLHRCSERAGSGGAVHWQGKAMGIDVLQSHPLVV